MHQKIRLAILECDTPIPSVDEKYHGYGGVFKALFNAAAKSEDHASAEDVFDFSVYQVVESPGTYPDLQNIDAVLLTGSSESNQSNLSTQAKHLRTRFFCRHSMDHPAC